MAIANDITEPAQHAAEPEEVIEAAVCALLSASCTVPVSGALTPASAGTPRELDAETGVFVAVDQASQDLDTRGFAVPHTYQARIVVRFALCDDKDGHAFRDECRAVRAVLRALTGDGCDALTCDSFACDAFIIDATSTSFEPGDNPVLVKAYSAALKGRIIQITEAN